MSHLTLILAVLVADHLQKTVKNIQNLRFDFDLVDIWRIRNPERRRFTWRQKKPFYSKKTRLLVNQRCLPRRNREV